MKMSIPVVRRISLFVVVGVFFLILNIVVEVSGFVVPHYSVSSQRSLTTSHNDDDAVKFLYSSVTDIDNDDDNTSMVVDVEFQTELLDSTTSTTGSTTMNKRSNVISIAQELRNKYGYLLNPFIVPKMKQTDLFDAILELEDDFMMKSTVLSSRDSVTAMLLGDWDLICTIAILPEQQQQQEEQQQPQRRQIPSLFDNEFIQNLFPSTLPMASLTNKFVTVTQKIRSVNNNDGTTGSTSTINRVDHVIEIKPPNQVSDLFDSSTSNSSNEISTPLWLKDLNINPFEVKESKVILIHTAEIVQPLDDDDTDTTKVKLRLKLQSVVNNIAGSGANLNPNGSDVVSVNVPQFDILNQNKELNDALGGSFITTYIDDEYRIGRSDLLFSSLNLGSNNNNNDDQKKKNNKAQQIRIFQKRKSTWSGATTTNTSNNNNNDDDEIADVDDIFIEAPSDVEE